jgi:PHD/YefM family antitoxin component YafN of YafNO toxin-antitoxin module
MKTLEASKIAAQFAKFLEQVHSLHASFRIVKKGVPYGYLVPAAEPKCDSHELADDLADAELSDDDRRSLSAAIRKGRKTLKPLKNSWNLAAVAAF